LRRSLQYVKDSHLRRRLWEI